MTSSGAIVARCEAASLDAASAQHYLAGVESAFRCWSGAVSDLLGIEAGPVRVVLRDGDRIPFTRGPDITLYVRPSLTETVAPLSHELVHALVGHSPRLAWNEGLAVYADDSLRLAGPVWPFYHLGLHRWVSSLRQSGSYVPLRNLLGMTRMPVKTAGATEMIRILYLEAGSFVSYFIESHGVETFWSYFRSGAIPSEDCVAELENGWRTAVGGPLTSDEMESFDRSMADVACSR